MRTMLKTFCGALLLATAAVAQAQDKFPTKQVTIVVPYATGGVTDLYGRAIGAKLSEMWGQPVVVDNRAGGGTLIGTQMASRAAPDGYTILLTSYAYTSNPILRKNMPYAPESLKPLLMLGKSANLLVLGSGSKLMNVKDVVAHAKASPGNFKVASSGMASSPHIAAELFGKAIGAEITHLAYKGTGPAMTDVLGGSVDGIFDGPSAMPQVRAGRLRAIAIAAEERHPAALEVPTFREHGIDLVFGSWFGFFLPAGVPPALEARLNADIRKALEDPTVRAQIDKTGIRLSLGTPQQFGDFLKAEHDRLKALVDSGAKIQIE
ncbi:MAG: tripartite tricarboxylate transporter substrate binding protein [Burkholderiales bacterium]|nr:tripartite tricarboxylate transporter substrate binding protein [Burkholderiales bacterium]